MGKHDETSSPPASPSSRNASISKQQQQAIHHGLASRFLQTPTPSIRRSREESRHLSISGAPPSENSPSVWNFSDYADLSVSELRERLSRSQYSFAELIESARDADPVSYQKAKEAVVASQSFVEGGAAAEHQNRWSALPVKQLLEEFGSDEKSGLNETTVKLNREKYGKNCLEREVREPLYRLFLSQFTSPVVILLITAAIVSAAFKEWVECTAIFIIITINAILATYMERSASDALAKLASLAAPSCSVLREGKVVKLPSEQLVRGDVVLVATGDAIPADLRLMEVAELRANEAILTGESEDVKKGLTASDATSAFPNNLCFASTYITNGSCVGLVYATGMDTQVGLIAQQLTKVAKSKPKLTPMQRAINKLGGIIAVIAIVVLVVIVVTAVVTQYRDPSHPEDNPVLSIILVAVGFCVSSIPEGLPMVVTICLSLGCKDMAARNANIRKLPAVETLGSCTVVCSDKTGTLTEGKMTAVKLLALCRDKKAGSPNGASSLVKSFDFYPTKGLEPSGGVYETRDLTADMKNSLAEKFGKGASLSTSEGLESIDDAVVIDTEPQATDYGDPQNDSLKQNVVRAACLAALLNSTAATLERNVETKKWEVKGNMSEGALVVAAAKAKWCCVPPPFRVKGTTDPTTTYATLKELDVPFNSTRKLSVTFHKLEQETYFDKVYLGGVGTPHSKFTHIALIKGAPDRLEQYVKHLLIASDGQHALVEVDWTRPVATEEASQMQRANEQLSSAALRVLLVAAVPLADDDVHHIQQCLSETDTRLLYILGCPVFFLGLMGSLDPPRQGVSEAIEDCNGAGVSVIMITGDQITTATAIGKSIGLVKGGDGGATPTQDSALEVLPCSDLHEDCLPTRPCLPEHVIDEMIRDVKVFARAQPEDKLQIVNALKRKGEIVAMTGDGVNDAPALKSAHIGVAMGITGTDVAKSAAEMVLLDDNFCTIAAAIEQGRTIYTNIQKFVCFLLGTNIGEILYLAISIGIGTKMPVEALQILFLNLMSDGCPAVALTREPPDHSVMKQPPRNARSHLMTTDWWIYGILPHTVFEALCVIGCLLSALYLATGAIFLRDINGQCVSNDQGTRYYCQTAGYVTPFSRPFDGPGFYTSIDYYNPLTNSITQVVNLKKGRFQHKLSPSDFNLSFPTDTCGVDSWCHPPEGFRPPSSYLWVNARGSRIATTQSFITAVFCEMMRAYTVRSWEWFFKVFNRNPWMHLACSISATSTLLLTVIPGLKDIFSVVTVAWWQYLAAIGWAVINTILDEVIPKPIYREVLKKRKEKESQPKEEDEGQVQLAVTETSPRRYLASP